jgi:hypothetical protein
MYGQLLGQVGDDARGGGVFADVLAGHEDDPESSATPTPLVHGENCCAGSVWWPR